MRCLPAAVVGAGLLTLPLPGAATILAPTPYLSAADSPFAGTAFRSFVRESWDGAPAGGYTASGGSRLPEGRLTDSVGGRGGSFYSSGNSSMSFDFAPFLAQHGRLPDHAGIVWTDVGYLFGESWPGSFTGIGEVRFEAFDANGLSLGATAAVLGDGLVNRTTAEDMFFGARHAAGISRITIAMPESGDWEVDDLQFGGTVPEPESWSLMIIGFGMVGFAMRQRRVVAA